MKITSQAFLLFFFAASFSACGSKKSDGNAAPPAAAPTPTPVAPDQAKVYSIEEYTVDRKSLQKADRLLGDPKRKQGFEIVSEPSVSEDGSTGKRIAVVRGEIREDAQTYEALSEFVRIYENYLNKYAAPHKIRYKDGSVQDGILASVDLVVRAKKAKSLARSFEGSDGTVTQKVF